MTEEVKRELLDSLDRLTRGEHGTRDPDEAIGHTLATLTFVVRQILRDWPTAPTTPRTLHTILLGESDATKTR